MNYFDMYNKCGNREKCTRATPLIAQLTPKTKEQEFESISN